MELRAKIWIEQEGELVFGRGRAELLEAIDSAGSISAAAQKTGMSYRHAWAMLKASEQRTGQPLLRRSRGGPGGGGTRLTEHARSLLRAFRSIEEEFYRLAQEKQRELQDLLD